MPNNIVEPVYAHLLPNTLHCSYWILSRKTEWISTMAVSPQSRREHRLQNLATRSLIPW